MARKPRSRRGSPPRRGRGKARSAAPKTAPKKSAPTAGQTAYQRRIARAMAQGKTLQEARGHKAKEHVSRRERELREGETTYQRGAIKKFAHKQARRSDRDPDTVVEEMQRWVRRRGWDQFVELREAVRRMSGMRRLRIRPLKGKGTRRIIDVAARLEHRRRMNAHMDALERRLGVDRTVLFYH